MPLLTVRSTASETGIKYNNSMPDFNLIWGIALFFAVLLGAYFLMRWLSKRTLLSSSGSVRVLERVMVGRDAYILLIQAGPRTMLVGVTKDGMSPLCELPPEEKGYTYKAAARSGDAPQAGPGFLRRFLHNFKIQSGLLPKDTPPMFPGSRPEAEADKPREIPAPAPPEAAAPSFASVLHHIQASSANVSHIETSDPEPPLESERKTEGSGKVSFSGLRINAPVKAAHKTQTVAAPAAGHPVQGPEQDAQPAQAAPKAAAPDFGSILDSLHQLGHIDDGRHVPFPVSAPITHSAQKARGVLEERRAANGKAHDTAAEQPAPALVPENSDAQPQPFGPPEVIIPLKPLKPRPKAQNTVWTVNPEADGQAALEGVPAPVSEETPAVADGSSGVPQFTANADEELELLKMLETLNNEESLPAPAEAGQRFEPRRTSRDGPPQTADKLDELFDRVERRSKRYSK